MGERKRHAPELIAVMLRQQEAGRNVTEICHEHEVSEQTLFRRKSKHGGMGAREVKRLTALEEENCGLKQLVAEKELDLRAMKTIIEGEY